MCTFIATASHTLTYGEEGRSRSGATPGNGFRQLFDRLCPNILVRICLGSWPPSLHSDRHCFAKQRQPLTPIIQHQLIGNTTAVVIAVPKLHQANDFLLTQIKIRPGNYDSLGVHLCLPAFPKHSHLIKICCCEHGRRNPSRSQRHGGRGKEHQQQGGQEECF